MNVGVYSLKKILYQGEAILITCRTKAGEITILKNHHPLISILDKGTIKIIDQSQKIEYIPINSGFLEVRPLNEVRLIVEEGV